MQKLVAVFLVLVSLAFALPSNAQPGTESPAPGYKDVVTGEIACRLRNVDNGWLSTWLAIRRINSDGRQVRLERGGYGYPYLDILDSLSNNKEIITPLVAKELGKPQAEIVLVSKDRWYTFLGEDKKPADNRVYVTVQFESLQEGLQVIAERLAMELGIYQSNNKISRSQIEQLAHRIAQAIAEKLPAASEATFLDMFTPQFEDAERAFKNARSNTQALESLRLEFTKKHPLSSEKLVERISGIEQQQLANRLALEGMKAREEALREQVALASKPIEKDAAAEERIAILQELVKLRESAAEYLKGNVGAGTLTQADADKAAAQVLEARIQLLNAKTKDTLTANSGPLESLNAELAKLAVDRAEAEAKNRFLENTHLVLIKVRNETLDDDGQIDRLTSEIDEEKKRIRPARQEVDRLKEIKAMFKPLELVVPPLEMK
jgi:hypothetical protein